MQKSVPSGYYSECGGGHAGGFLREYCLTCFPFSVTQVTETYGASAGDRVRCGSGGGGRGLGDFSRVIGLGGSCIENGDGPLTGIDGGRGNGGGTLEGGAGSDGKGGGVSLGS